jgi:type II secretory pathway component PulK
VLIIVMWIAFGVVALALYFGHTMEMNIRMADNDLAGMQATQAIEAGAVYASNVLANVLGLNTTGGGLLANTQPFMLPQTNYYQTAAVRVGEARFWFIGRDTNDTDFSRRSPEPVFGLQDEAARINLNSGTNEFGSPDSTASTNLLQNLPGMTAQRLAALYDWTTSSSNNQSMNGAKSLAYQGLNPPYLCKGTNFDTIGELRMVYYWDVGMLYGEDANLNNALDPNENDGSLLPPYDNSDGKLDPGILSYVTVYTHEPTNLTGSITNVGTSSRIVLTNSGLTNFIATNFPSVYSAISANLRTMGTVSNALQFAIKSKITESDFIKIEPFLLGPNTNGLININTATAVAIGCIPGIGTDGIWGQGSVNAQNIALYRQGIPSRLNSVYWLKDAMANMGTNAMFTAGNWITSHSWQYTADIAAVGRFGRGYRRVRFVFDCSSGVPQIVYRQDLTYLGWALGKKIHDQLLAGKL